MHSRISSIARHTTHLTTLIFVVGFLFDMYILPDIDHTLTQYLGASYLLVIAVLIMFRELVIAGNRASSFERTLYSVSSFGIAYFSGSSLSFICVYAIRSAAFSVAWPFFALLLACILANELVDTHDFRMTLDIGILFIATLFYLIFNVPIFLKVQNDFIFTVSVASAMVLTIVYIYFLQFISEGAEAEAPRAYALAIGIPMFVWMLYSLNVIPAVPLSLKEGGVYHHLVRTETGNFTMSEEVDSRIFSKFRRQVYHITNDDSDAYFFSAVDAPAMLTAPVSHTWEYYDSAANKWKQSFVISFTIEGGRDSGYRAYSKKENISEGLWRVTVSVDGKRIVGRSTFYVEKADNVTLKDIQF